MACNSVSISGSPIASTTKDMPREHNSLRRSHSGKDLCDPSGLRRSKSDPQLRYSLNCIRAASLEPKLKKSRSTGIFPFQLSGSVRSPPFDPDMDIKMRVVDYSDDTHEGEEESEKKKKKKKKKKKNKKRANWVERLLELRSHWRSRQQKEQATGNGDEGKGSCVVDYGPEDEEEGTIFDQESFSRLLVRVPLSDTKLLSQLAFLCNIAYVIPEIKAEDLSKYYDLHFVTSSLEKKEEAAAVKAKFDADSTRVPLAPSIKASSRKALDFEQKRPIRPSVAYQIASSAASYVHSRTRGLLSLGCGSNNEDLDVKTESHNHGDQPRPREDEGCSSSRAYKSEMAAYVAASTMTAVVAAEEAAKQEAARDLRSLHSSPCEWFVCDDPSTCTRCFIIQGSDSLASWQANLFFEPTKFEGTEVLVHRGIYEAAKGIYEQFTPEILSHLKKHGDGAKLRFTGHSLGGSLSLLVSLMLLARGVIKPPSLLPVVTFGSPFIFCGGHRILEELNLDESHVRSVMMHRDIVPRAFSCNYPNHVVQVLKRLNGAFRSHPCLNNNKLLYGPMGRLYILQPDEKSSPPHPLLPPGTALYVLNETLCGSRVMIASALRAFLNSPHPLETLSDPKAYGSEGTILRDHESINYSKAVNGVLRQQTKVVVQRPRTLRLHHICPLLTTPSPHSWRNQDNFEKSRLIVEEVASG
ncbi:PREDICTED: uncharacterized protein LOC104600342 [Nelumbo nucifera]|uniref:Uncharacterized protein LOC104600342 n=1 Tax=Nelumbo nucifera TaxID=4432 RepID=A0A1U8A8U1_NELNU|nr:PREDICTED: uncharacterized protein LOC104600342 [Nelumbo nucifera]